MQPRRFLITGGSRGIGAAIVDLTRKAGHEVVFTGRDEQLIERVTQDTGAYGVRADVSVGEDNARTVEVCREQMGAVDVLVNNAAVGYDAEIGNLDVDAMRSLFETNVFGLVDISNRIVPMIKSEEQGDIVNIASTSGMKGGKMGTAYAASKWTVRGISQCWQGRAPATRHPRHQRVPVGGADRLERQGRSQQPEQAVRGRHRRNGGGGDRHAASCAVARAGCLRDQPVERGMRLPFSQMRFDPGAAPHPVAGLVGRRSRGSR